MSPDDAYIINKMHQLMPFHFLPQLDNRTSMTETVCLCNHLTSFGGDFAVPPNTIDFSTVFSAAKFVESLPVTITVLLVLLLYIVILVWGRRMDKKDLLKVNRQ